MDNHNLTGLREMSGFAGAITGALTAFGAGSAAILIDTAMLRDIALSEAERLLIDTEITDTKAACDIYSNNFPHEGFPLFPFLKVCNFPVLFKSGGVIRSHEKFHSDTL